MGHDFHICVRICVCLYVQVCIRVGHITGKSKYQNGPANFYEKCDKKMGDNIFFLENFFMSCGALKNTKRLAQFLKKTIRDRSLKV